MLHRNALSVLPEPVGAQISVFSPLAILGQPATCAGVGASHDASNQRRVRSLNGASGSVVSVRTSGISNRPILRVGVYRLLKAGT